MQLCLKAILDQILGWPIILYVLGLSFVCTIATKWIQIRCFFTAWKTALQPAEEEKTASADMTPLQAFINTLSSNLGNSSLAGMATALFAGGPGAAIWVLIAGFLLMAVRFAEIYLSLYLSKDDRKKSKFGGPMRYLHEVPFGAALAYLYAAFGLCYGLLVGNAVQTNSIALSLHTTWHISPYMTAALLFLFVAYVMSGGAQRIAKMNEAIVPIKVVVFFAASIALLLYHYQSLIPSLQLMLASAFTCKAIAGGAAGFGIQMAMRFGISRVVFATESGLGTAAIMFGSTGSKKPIEDALLGMLSTFISSVVCFLVAWCIVASGVWDNGLTSTALTIASFETVFGQVAGWIVSFLSLSFGAGVLVAYGYITQETWRYVTNDRYPLLFVALFSATAFWGAIANVGSVWFAGEVANAGMLFINLFGITYLLPVLYRGIVAAKKGSC